MIPTCILTEVMFVSMTGAPTSPTRGVCITHGGKVKSCIHTGCTMEPLKDKFVKSMAQRKIGSIAP
jgi:hypothetical protein